MAFLANLLLAVGAIFTVVAISRTVGLIRIYLLPSRFDRYAHRAPDGSPPWAMVTGASDGIGLAFAGELASRGFNVVLHGRNPDKLARVMADLQARNPERTFRIVIADAATVACVSCIKGGGSHGGSGGDAPLPSPPKQERLPSPPGETPAVSSPPLHHQHGKLPGGALDFSILKAAVADLHLTVLINNAGNGPSDPIYSPLGGSSEARITGNVSLNALFPMHLMRELLPTLGRNGPALVMNISSITDQGFPLLTSYGSSKRFMMTVTRSVRLELQLDGQADNVELLGIRIGRVTGVSGYKEKPSFFTPDTVTMARAALSRAGHGHGVVDGYWCHALQQFLLRLLPQVLRDRLVMDVIKGEREEELRSMGKNS
ncbi:hypothetical protein K4F52_005399 [Lecanicillium sp. MT-2017a]|nr:hypothetical protein K4F52_005399 [Lecanicillium sp. MT-2017a]